MATLEDNQLADRTRRRNDKLWLTLDWGGLLDPLASQQAIEDNLGLPGIENYMAIADETWDIKSAQRDRTYEIDQFSVEQDRLIAEEKVVVGLTKLAIQKVTDYYILVVKQYGAAVRALLMGAKEFAALVEREQLANEALQVALAIQKELLRRDKIQAAIYMEAVKQAQVEEEIVRAQLAVVKANLAVKREELKLKEITAKIYYATIERAQVEVDIAKAYLDVDKTVLAIGREELHKKESSAKVYYETIQQAQMDADLAKAELDILRAELAAAQADLQVKEANAKVYYESVQQAQVGTELAKTELAVTKTELDVDKEELRLAKTQANIYLETINQKQVEADIAKAQVDVAKAHVRAILADIAAGEADIRVITAEIEQYMAQADKAGLRADVAMIFAEILTKQLSAVKLDMGQAEITAGFEFIQQKLDDALALLAIQERGEQVKTDYAEAALEEIRLLFPEEKVSEDLRETEQLNAREVFNYAQSATYQNILAEIALRALAVNARTALMDTKKDTRQEEDIMKTWAEELVNDAQKWVHKHSQRGTTEYYTQYEYITG